MDAPPDDGIDVDRRLRMAITAGHRRVSKQALSHPNVFYEIGIAHTVGKPVILIAQRDDDIPADIGHIKYIRYDLSESGLQQLEAALTRTIHATLGIYEGLVGAHGPAGST